MNTAAYVALTLGLVGGLIFLVPYVVTVRGWWREEHRAHVVVFTGVIVGFLLLYVLRAIVPPDPFQWVRLVLLWLLALAVDWRAWIFLRGVRRRRAARRLPRDVP